MKTKENRSKWPLLFYTIMLIGITTAKADNLDKFKKTLARDFAGSVGIYIIGGLVVASLLIYIIYNHFINKDKGEETQKTTVKPGFNYKRHKHHHHTRQAVKKTA